MKNIGIILAVLFGFIFQDTIAQNKAKKSETIQITTSAVCGMCKKTIETALYDLKGVKSASLDVSSKVVTVIYKPSSVTPLQLRTTITQVGYDADDLPADTKAYDNLHGCCKKGSH